MDKFGSLASFTTAGVGPIPKELVRRFPKEFRYTEERIIDLPVISKSILHVEMNDPSSFIDIAKRGIYVFDWSDVHMRQKYALDAYELTVTPLQPLKAQSLPQNLEIFTDLIAFPDEDFSKAKTIDPRLSMSCVDGKYRLQSLL